MGLLEKIFGSKTKEDSGKVMMYFKTLNGYSPVYSDFNGGLYEMEQTRAAVHCFATHCSKLRPDVSGNAYKELAKTLPFQPNPWMDTTKFLYRIATQLSVTNTAFIIPLTEITADSEKIIGFYPLISSRCEILEWRGEPWLRYTFGNGSRALIEFNRVGIVNQYFYRDDFFGENDGNNYPLMPTLKVMSGQRKAMLNSIKTSADIKYMARVGNVIRDDDLEKERERFSKMNLSEDNDTGVMIFDGKYADVKQVESKQYIVDAAQTKLINTNVYNYFGCNEAILQNRFTEEEWNAYYEGKIEPFAVQLSLVMTNMLVAHADYVSKGKGINKIRAFGNEIVWTANRMQYASNKTKLEVSTQLFDRGILTTNQVMDIWNLPHVEGGDERHIRLEYANSEEKENNKNGNGSKIDTVSDKEDE